jgi:hypothetical protein
MTTKRQIEANRRNAQHSTGPSTEAGKAAASRNSLKHGLFSREIVVDDPRVGEDPEQFEALQEDLRAELAPQGALQELLVERAAVHFWRLKRAARYEAARITHDVRRHTAQIEQGIRAGTHSQSEIHTRAMDFSLLQENELRALLKYEAQQERGLQSVLKELRELKREQARRERAAADAAALAKIREKVARDQAHAEQMHGIVMQNPVAPWLLKEAAQHLRQNPGAWPADGAGPAPRVWTDERIRAAADAFNAGAASPGKIEPSQDGQVPGKGKGSGKR